MNTPVFQNKVVIITGASSGIGRELAHQLADQGALLVLAARNVERLEAAKTECLAHGGKAIVLPTDVGIAAQCAHMVQGTMEEFGRIDALVNNAGITMWGSFDAVNDLGIFEQIMRTNYLGSLYCTHYALPFLKQTKGLIVGVSSLAGKAGIPTRSGYAASKHAMTGFFDSLRIELEPFGVGVTMIYPGFVASDVRARALGPDGKPLVTSPVREGEVMMVETCARLMVSAMTRRKREVVMTLRGKLGQWLKLIAPGVVDRVASQAIKSGR
jgi:NAD(P)-dependent dehydrogenase (short-subunit alcohol dehydrogenase family)